MFYELSQKECKMVSGGYADEWTCDPEWGCEPDWEWGGGDGEWMWIEPWLGSGGTDCTNIGSITINVLIVEL
jgi:hypothetical protein